MRKETPLSKREYEVLKSLSYLSHNIFRRYSEGLDVGKPKSRNDPTYELYSEAYSALLNISYDLADIIWNNYLDYDIARLCADKRLTYDEYLSLLSHEEKGK